MINFEILEKQNIQSDIVKQGMNSKWLLTRTVIFLFLLIYALTSVKAKSAQSCPCPRHKDILGKQTYCYTR